MRCPSCLGAGHYCGRCMGSGEVEVFVARTQVKKYRIGPVLEALGMDYVPAGSGWVRCKCFHHPDNRASASVNHTLNAYKCHTCVMQGDAIAIVRHVEGMNFAEAVEFCERVTDGSSDPVSRKSAEPTFSLFS